MRAAVFFGRVTPARRGVATFLDLRLGLTLRRFAEAVRGFAFCLRATTFAAFRARALPFGERLVAGFRRVDFPAKTRLRDADLTDE